MPEPTRTLKITCREHGLIWSETVHCHHDVQDALEHVGKAHSAKYGAACASVVDVKLTDDGKTEGWRRYPGVADA